MPATNAKPLPDFGFFQHTGFAAATGLAIHCERNAAVPLVSRSLSMSYRLRESMSAAVFGSVAGLHSHVR